MSALPQTEATEPVSNGTVKSVFAHLDCLVDAIDALKRAGVRDMVVTAPLPRHEIEELLYEGRPSPVRWFTLCGAIFGGVFGFSLCSFTHLNWAMIIPAGKPLVSIPAFLVITFESTVLWGCLATLVGLMLLCRLPGHNLQPELQDPRFSDDVFGLVVNNLGRKQAAKVAEILTAEGAIEVTDGYTDGEEEEEAPDHAPITDQGWEPDEPNIGMLVRVSVGMTILIVLGIIFSTLYFQKSIGDQLKAQGYSTTSRAVTPINRPNQ
ncbi:MAG: hypothetical protein ACI8S6_005822 [Myxococcota bacterium]|jgi:hypothetical protein